MIITCPHCGTRYRVSYEAIGSAGRKVQCAACDQDWREMLPAPVDEAPLDAEAEAALDAALADAEPAIPVATGTVVALGRRDAAASHPPMPHEFGPEPDPEAERVAAQRLRQYKRRRKRLGRSLPLARIRRVGRWVILVTLIAVLAGGYYGRFDIVERYPELAGLYAVLGLDVNVLGLEFAEFSTVRGLRDGQEVLSVRSQIVGLRRDPVTVPSVVVTLLDEARTPIYQWSVTPKARSLMAGERVDFDTQLAQPPDIAVGVRLSFAHTRSAAADATASTADNGGTN